MLAPRLVILLFCLSLHATARGQTLELEDSSSGELLNAHVELLEDVSGQLGIEDIQRADIQQRFSPANGRVSVGQSPHPWWIKVSLRRAESAPPDWWLEVGAVTPQDLQFFLPEGSGWRQRQSGERVSFSEGRDYAYRRVLLRLPELSGTPLTFYLRSHDPAGNSFPMRAWQLDELQERAALENLALGLLYGVILALLLYNLFILFSLRDRAYFWYVATTASALLFILSMSGHGFQYLWPDGAVPVWLDRITLPSLWGLCACRFTQALLQTRLHVRWAHRLFNLACLTYLLAIGLNLLGERGICAWIIAILAVVSIPAALGSAVLRLRRGFFPALFYLCGYGLVLLSVAILVMRSTGILQPAPLTAFFFPLAVAAESILFSFALAYRIQRLKQERATALELAGLEKEARLQQMQHFAAELQHAVSSRTAELARSNERLCQRERELEHAARHDPLTDLPNRRYLMEHCEGVMADAERRQESLVMMLIDLDNFKPVNDTHGHDVGDILLRTQALRLRNVVRSHDMVARLGGDEFAVLISGPQAEQYALEIAERLLSELAQPVQHREAQLRVTVSIGLAFYPLHARQFSALYKTADQALYKAKGCGRSSYRVFGDDGELSYENRLRVDVLKTPSGLF